MPVDLSVVIVDDQRLARARLRDLLSELPGVSVMGEATDGEEALGLIARTRPDVALLDIEMPGLSGLQVARAAEPGTRVIFTTAYDRFAITAFELNAVDYLLKPFGAARLRAALDRARDAIAAGASLDRLEHLAAAIDRKPSNVDRVFVQERGRITAVALADVERLQAERDYVAFHVGARAHLVRIRFTDLLERLDPASFVRVHRSHAVNLSFVRFCEPLADSRLAVTLASGAQVVASRAGSRELRRRLRLES